MTTPSSRDEHPAGAEALGVGPASRAFLALAAEPLAERVAGVLAAAAGGTAGRAESDRPARGAAGADVAPATGGADEQGASGNLHAAGAATDGTAGLPPWAVLQQAFLDMVEAYVEAELAKPAAGNIRSHEAGGQWRIAFPHLQVRPDGRLGERFAAVIRARKAHTDAAFYHGYPDCTEVHHEPETFLYFQSPLVHANLPGADLALACIEDVAHHAGNWAAGVPPWYDWDAHGFVSAWLGTRATRARPPYDYQEANHFRFIHLCLTVYAATGRQRYLDLARDYADRWCEHIERLAEAGEPIRCSILPTGVTAGEMGFGGERQDAKATYRVFYSIVRTNTAYDVAGTLLDLYRLTQHDRYRAAAAAMLDAFFAHGRDGRPATQFQDGAWRGPWPDAQPPGNPGAPGTPGTSGTRAAPGAPGAPAAYLAQVQSSLFLSRLAMRHDLLTGRADYRERMLAWAAALDEANVPGDQIAPGPLVAAHFYDGEAAWLARAYAMALRGAAVTEADDRFHQCNSRMRQGFKYVIDLLYAPLLAGVEWGTRGDLPLSRLGWRHDGAAGLPRGTSVRTWRRDAGREAFDVVHGGPRAVELEVVAAERDPAGDQPAIARVEGPAGPPAPGGRFRVPAGGSLRGTIHWTRAR